MTATEKLQRLEGSLDDRRTLRPRLDMQFVRLLGRQVSHSNGYRKLATTLSWQIRWQAASNRDIKFHVGGF